MAKPRTNFEPQISQREGVWGLTLRITTNGSTWTSPWGPLPEAKTAEQAAVAARLTVKRMKEKLG